MKKRDIETIMKHLPAYHGGQTSASYALMSSLIHMRDARIPFSIKHLYCLPIKEALKEIASLYNSTNLEHLSKSDKKEWMRLVKAIDALNTSIASERRTLQRRFISRTPADAIIVWGYKDAPWYFDLSDHTDNQVSHVIYCGAASSQSINWVAAFNNTQFITTHEVLRSCTVKIVSRSWR